MTSATFSMRQDATGPRNRRKHLVAAGAYPLWFHVPAAALFLVLFAVPTFASFYFSLTRWTLFDVEFIGLENFVDFLTEPMLSQSLVNTLVFGIVTSVLSVVLGLALALLLTGPIMGRGFLRSTVFFPVLVSTIGVGITFAALMDPFDGLINTTLRLFGIDGPGWLTDPSLALLSVALVTVWKGLGVGTVIYMAGLVAIPQEYFEAARCDGAGRWAIFRRITLPLVSPATATVVLLALINGLRSFDLIWVTTRGGPGFSSDVIASVIYKQYQAGFYGLSTAGNVLLFIFVTAIVVPVFSFLNKRAVES